MRARRSTPQPTISRYFTMTALTGRQHALTIICPVYLWLDYRAQCILPVSYVPSCFAVDLYAYGRLVITGPPNGPLFLGGWHLSSSVVVCNPAGGRAGRPPSRARGWSGGRYCTAGQYRYVPLGRHSRYAHVGCQLHGAHRGSIPNISATGLMPPQIPLGSLQRSPNP